MSSRKRRRRRVGHPAKGAGVDLGDERAVANFVAGWNARSDGE